MGPCSKGVAGLATAQKTFGRRSGITRKKTGSGAGRSKLNCIKIRGTFPEEKFGRDGVATGTVSSAKCGRGTVVPHVSIKKASHKTRSSVRIGFKKSEGHWIAGLGISDKAWPIPGTRYASADTVNRCGFIGRSLEISFVCTSRKFARPPWFARSCCGFTRGQN